MGFGYTRSICVPNQHPSCPNSRSVAIWHAGSDNCSELRSQNRLDSDRSQHGALRRVSTPFPASRAQQNSTHLMPTTLRSTGASSAGAIARSKDSMNTWINEAIIATEKMSYGRRSAGSCRCERCLGGESHVPRREVRSVSCLPGTT